MRVIPVMDLKDGLAVHAIRGQRAQYRPVAGRLVADGDPRALLRAYRQVLGLHEAYIADLNAIQGHGHHRDLLAGLAQEADMALMVDAGVTDSVQAVEMLAHGVRKVVVGSETLATRRDLEEIGRRLPAGQLVFSLDMRGGQVLARDSDLAALAPLAVLRAAYESGCCEVILLDLARVGTAAGPDRELIAAAHACCPGLAILAGGGVRNVEDLAGLRSAGASGALVATALHSGAIDRHEIAKLSAV